MGHRRISGGLVAGAAGVAALVGAAGVLQLLRRRRRRGYAAERVPPPEPSEADHAAALRTKLAACLPEVSALFDRLDAETDRVGPIVNRRHGRDGRSYKVGARRLATIDPKTAYLRIWVGEDAYAAAPPELKDDSYQQKDWLRVRPADETLAHAYLRKVWRERLGR